MSSAVAVPSSPSRHAEPSTGVPANDAGAFTPFAPPPPRTFADAGLTAAFVETLVLKYLLGVGAATGGAVAKELCLPNAPMIELLAALKAQQIVGYVGAATAGDFTYSLTDAGRDRARRYMLENMYVGAAPVPIEQYIAGVNAQTITRLHPGADDLRRAFSDLLINDRMFATLGPAINSGRGMFLYGYPGNGKSSIAERITRCFGDEVFIPKIVSADGMLIKLFDPEAHEVVASAGSGIFRSSQFDERWVKVKRPTLIVGGELTMDMLEVRYNETSRICEAPMQMKSNNGTFVIDDFGRQRMRPIELLNRWIVPLEKRYDFLTLPNGKKLRIPFDQLIIFSTNLEPKDLVDEAFLRRIPYKINVADPSEAEFRKLFEIFAPKMDFPANPAALDYFIDTYYRKTSRPFRCCQPRDILLQIRNRCLYESRSMELSNEAFDFAAAMYFTVM
ncbi:MAG: AAA family ATPase [Phycisphaerae bacterium]